MYLTMLLHWVFVSHPVVKIAEDPVTVWVGADNIGAPVYELLAALEAGQEVVLVVILHAILVLCPAVPIFKNPPAPSQEAFHSIVVVLVTNHLDWRATKIDELLGSPGPGEADITALGNRSSTSSRNSNSPADVNMSHLNWNFDKWAACLIVILYSFTCCMVACWGQLKELKDLTSQLFLGPYSPGQGKLSLKANECNNNWNGLLRMITTVDYSTHIQVQRDCVSTVHLFIYKTLGFKFSPQSIQMALNWDPHEYLDFPRVPWTVLAVTVWFGVTAAVVFDCTSIHASL